MTENKKDQELTEQELEQATGGARTRRAEQPMQTPKAPPVSMDDDIVQGDPGVSIGGVSPLPDPPFQS